LGDDVQAIKAGIMEIADVLVVNKADQDNADRVVQALQLALRLGPATPWTPPIIKCVAMLGRGIVDVHNAIEQHRSFLREDGRWQQRERERVRSQILDLVEHRLMERVLATVGEARLAALVESVVDRKSDPYAAVDSLLEAIGSIGSRG
jgi:LAO/AO transport system kinase